MAMARPAERNARRRCKAGTLRPCRGGRQPGRRRRTHRTPIQAPGEPAGPLPYFLPDQLAVPLGYQAKAASNPTLGEYHVDGDVVTIRATGCAR